MTTRNGSVVMVDGVMVLGKVSVTIDNGSSSAKKIFRNCKFYGPCYFVVSSGGSGTDLLFDACEFKYSKNNCVIQTYNGVHRIVNCVFSDCFACGNSSSQTIIHSFGGGAVYVQGTTFTRCNFYTTSYNGGCPPAALVSWNVCNGHAVDGCVVSNVYAASGYECSISLMGLKNGRLSNTLFLNNRTEVKPFASRAYPMVFSHFDYGSGMALTYDGLSFIGNTIAAPALSLAAGNYAMGILGTCSATSYSSIYNCSFVSNRVEAVEVDGVTGYLSSGILFSQSHNTASGSEMSVANCLFMDGNEYDVVHYAHSHTKTFEILNSIFTRGYGSLYDPIYSDKPSLLNLIKCTVGGQGFLPDGCTFTGLVRNYVPFGLISSGKNLVPQPLALMEGLRDSADLSFYSRTVTSHGIAQYTTLQYRLRAEDSWTTLMDKSGTILKGDVEAITDATGATRPFGSFTRGPVQELAEGAEDGRLILFESDPISAATFSSAHYQVLGDGEAISPVTAIPNEGYTFVGWYKEDGTTLITTEAMLTAAALGDYAGSKVIAKIGVPQVTLTFDLGEYATFENGKTTYEMSLKAGETVPALPKIIETIWHFEGWDKEVPALAPDKSVIFNARAVSKNVRTLYVVPADDPVVATSDKSGSSWANAATDIQAAINDAGRYRGEVWFKKGIYTLAGAIMPKSNVALIGGFDGTETTAAQADPVKNVTLFTGDVSKNNFWKYNNVDPGAGKRSAIWDYETLTFNEPNFTALTDYVYSNGNNGDDAIYGISDNGNTTNALIQGLNVSCFQKNGLVIGAGSDIRIVNTRFLANNTSNGESAVEAGVHLSGNSRFEGCDFIGTSTPVYVADSADTTPGTNAFVNCRFMYNAGGQGSARGFTVLDAERDLILDGCLFYGNSQWDYGKFSDSPLQIEKCRNLTFRKTRFERNAPRNGTFATVYISSVSGDFLVDGCVFTNNWRIGQDSHWTSSGSASMSIFGLAKPGIIKNTLFACNVVTNQSYNHGNYATETSQTSTAATIGNSIVTFINTTFINNYLDNHDSYCYSHGGTVRAWGKAVTFINCAFKDNIIKTNGEKGWGAEIYMTGTDKNRLSLVNSVFWNEQDDYLSVTNGSVRPMAILSSAIKNYDSEQYSFDGGYERNVFTKDPIFAMKGLTELGGIYAIGLGATTPYRRKGATVYLGTDNYVYYYDSEVADGKPWRCLNNSKYASATQPTVIDINDPRLPDAFGKERIPNKFNLAPIDPANLGLVIRLR